MELYLRTIIAAHGVGMYHVVVRYLVLLVLLDYSHYVLLALTCLGTYYFVRRAAFLVVRFSALGKRIPMIKVLSAPIEQATESC